MKRPVVIWPDRILARRAEAVPEVDDYVRRLLDDMVETLEALGGGGLAAPQVGFALRCVVLAVHRLQVKAVDGDGKPVPQPDRTYLKLVNPLFGDASVEWATGREGCLSVPGYTAMVKRHKSIQVAAMDENGGRVEVVGDGLLAVALQHEIDHLDGITIADKEPSWLKKDLLKRRLVKAKKRGLRYNLERPEPRDFTVIEGSDEAKVVAP